MSSNPYMDKANKIKGSSNESWKDRADKVKSSSAPLWYNVKNSNPIQDELLGTGNSFNSDDFAKKLLSDTSINFKTPEIKPNLIPEVTQKTQEPIKKTGLLQSVFGKEAYEEYKKTHTETPDPIKPLGFALETFNRIPLTQRLMNKGAEFMGVDRVNFDGTKMETMSTGNNAVDTLTDVGGSLLGAALTGGGGGTKSLLNAADDIGLHAATKVGAKTSNKLIPTLVRGAVDSGASTALEDISKGVDLQTTAKDTAINSIGGAFLFGTGKVALEGLGKIRGLIGKGELTKIDLPKDIQEETNPLMSPLKPKFKGNFTVKNTMLQKAVSDYNQAIEDVQNHFKHYQLTPEEALRVKSELGIDLEKLIKNIEEAHVNGANTTMIGERARFKQIVGVGPEPRPLQKPLESPLKKAPGFELDNFLGSINGVGKKLDSNIKPGPVLTPKPNINLESPLSPKIPQQGLKLPEVFKGLTPQNPTVKESKLLPSLNDSIFINNKTKEALENSKEKYYEPITNKETWSKAQAEINSNFTKNLAELSSKESFTSADDVAKGFAVIEELQKKGDYKAAADFAESMIPKSRKLGQAVQAHAIVGRLSPEGVLNYAIKQYDKANTQLPTGSKIKVGEDHLKGLREKAEIIQDMPDGRAKEIAQAQLLADIEKPIPVSFAKKLSTAQAMSHLLNVQTTLRNLLGNTGFNIAEQISKLYAIPFDKAIAGMKTGQRSVTTPDLKTFGRSFKDGWKDSIEEIKLGVDLGGSAKYDLPQQQTFRGGLLGKAEKALNYTLKVPDEAFKRGVYEESVLNQVKAAGLKEPTSEMMDQAKKEALYATFQDNSLPAQIITGLKDILNKVGIGNEIRGASGIKTREFGLGDLTVKYTRVPGNIIARSVSYSPLGYLKVLNLLNEAKISGKLNQRDLAMTLGRATNGSAMIGLGVLMHRLGLLKSEDKDLDKDQRELERSEGLGNYKLNLSALNRVLDNGFSKQDTKPGDTLASYNWFTPLSTSFAIGAAIDSEMMKQNSDLAVNVGATSLEEMLDIPTLTVIQQMFYESQKSDSNILTIASVPVKQAIPGFIPSQLRQVSRATDPLTRNIKGDTPEETFVNGLKNNTPLSKDLTPKLSPLGKEISNDVNPLVKLLSPAAVTKYNPSVISDPLKQLSKDTGNKNIFPSQPPKTITQNKQTVSLTEADKFKYLKIAGSETEFEYEKVLRGLDIRSLSDKAKQDLADKLEKIQRLSRDKAKEQILKDKSIK